MNKTVSTRTGFGEGLVELAQTQSKILATSADTYRSFALNSFVEKYPDRYFEFGIAEQNMLTASAAMAAEGYCVFSVGYSPFLSMRALEQIRTFIAYPNLDVKIVAGLSGLSGDTDGVTHQGSEDLGIVRTIPNMTILCPADAVAAKKFVRLAAEISGPVYLRLGRGATPVFYEEGQDFAVGHATILREYGKDAVLLACGPCVFEAVQAADRLRERGVMASVLDMHTIKPLDAKTLCNFCADARTVVTVEDGTIYGGLGGAVAETLLENQICPQHFLRLGLKTFGTAGTLPELLHFFKLDADGIMKQVLAAK